MIRSKASPAAEAAQIKACLRTGLVRVCVHTLYSKHFCMHQALLLRPADWMAQQHTTSAGHRPNCNKPAGSLAVPSEVTRISMISPTCSSTH